MAIRSFLVPVFNCEQKKRVYEKNKMRASQRN